MIPPKLTPQQIIDAIELAALQARHEEVQALLRLASDLSLHHQDTEAKQVYAMIDRLVTDSKEEYTK